MGLEASWVPSTYFHPPERKGKSSAAGAEARAARTKETRSHPDLLEVCMGTNGLFKD
jgi:hypothetical protein